MVKEHVESGLMDNTKYKDGVNQNARLIVRNVSFRATEEALKEHFSPYGTVEEIKLLKKPDGKLVGCGFVHFTHVPMANKALTATNKKAFLGRPLNVSWALPKHKYNEKQDNNERARLDSISSVDHEENVKSEPSANRTSTNKSQEKNNTRINRNARLIVRNISFKATENMLREHFSSYGDIIEVKLLKKPDGKLVGCGFVHFKNVPMAKKALLNTNTKPFLGRPISVDWAVAKDKYMQHIVTKETEMLENVKVEDSDDDDEKPLNTEEEIKQEVKSESDDSDSDEKDFEDENSDLEDDEEPDNVSVTSTLVEKKRIQLNDAEDGCTVFITNIPFSVDDEQLKQFVEQTAPVRYALVCIDKLTEHSKGTGFVKFTNKEDAEKFLALSPEQLKLEGQVMLVKPALKKENLRKDKKQPKDNRNLYLVKEGVIVAGSAAAAGVSASDMAKRLALERSKTQMLRNLNRFVSRLRLVVSNLPARADDAALRRLAERAAPGATVTEARVMRDLRAPPAAGGRHVSKGYGFVMFTKHEDALACLRALNNNPDIFDKNNRPIVSFSIEDRTALNARKKRLEKSIANNPLSKNDGDGTKRNRKRKSKMAPDESYIKKRKFNKDSKENPSNKQLENGNSEVGKFVRRPRDDQTNEYSGLTAKAGTQHKIRNNHKLRMQETLHKQNVKLEKKKNKHTSKLKKATRERVKLPKQNINKNPNIKRRKRKNNKLSGAPLDKLL